LAHFLRNACLAADEAFDHAHSKAAQARHVLRAVPLANARAIFVEIPVDDVVTTVFYGPVPAIGGKDLFWISLNISRS
jgi:hypothetical protein